MIAEAQQPDVIIPRTKHERKRAEIETLLEGRSRDLQVQDILDLLDSETQKAFRAGMGRSDEDTCHEKVSTSAREAIKANITDPRILSNLYSKEQGFKL